MAKTASMLGRPTKGMRVLTIVTPGYSHMLSSQEVTDCLMVNLQYVTHSTAVRSLQSMRACSGPHFRPLISAALLACRNSSMLRSFLSGLHAKNSKPHIASCWPRAAGRTVGRKWFWIDRAMTRPLTIIYSQRANLCCCQACRALSAPLKSFGRSDTENTDSLAAMLTGTSEACSRGAFCSWSS